MKTPQLVNDWLFLEEAIVSLSNVVSISIRDSQTIMVKYYDNNDEFVSTPDYVSSQKYLEKIFTLLSQQDNPNDTEKVRL